MNVVFGNDFISTLSLFRKNILSEIHFWLFHLFELCQEFLIDFCKS